MYDMETGRHWVSTRVCQWTGPCSASQGRLHQPLIGQGHTGTVAVVAGTVFLIAKHEFTGKRESLVKVADEYPLLEDVVEAGKKVCPATAAPRLARRRCPKTGCPS